MSSKIVIIGVGRAPPMRARPAAHCARRAARKNSSPRASPAVA